MKYRADIDGLRALAVIPVVFFHVDMPLFGGGFVGVDVFFVISGYVIANSLLDDLVKGRFSILRFYERRVRRIFPALIFTFALCWIAAWLLLLPSDLEDFSKSLLASAAFTSNIYFWKFSGYFDPSALLRPLLHTWSLSVEEQFYIFIPVGMLLVHRYFGGKWVIALWPAICASFALSVYAGVTAPTANFFLLPTRAWELLLGVALALSPPPAAPRRLTEAIAAFGVVFIAFAVISYSKATPFPGANALPPCLGAVLLIYAGTHRSTAVTRALSYAPVVWIGLVSYSLYLVHWPIIAFFRYATLQTPTLAESIAIVIASAATAHLSWRYIEQPFRRTKKSSPSRLLLGGVGAMSVVMVFGLAGVVWRGAPWRFPDFPRSIVNQSNLWHHGTCFLLGDQDYRAWNARACTLSYGKPETALLWGDSFAAHYGPGVIANASRMSSNVLQYTAAGCPPILSYFSYRIPRCQEFNRHALEIIKQNDIKVVIMAARWTEIEQRGFSMVAGTIATLKQAGVEVWLIGQSVEFTTSVEVIAYRKGTGPRGTDAWPIAIGHDINARLQAFATGARFIDPLPYLCDDWICAYRDQGAFLYEDYGHFSRVGSSRAVMAYFPLVRRDNMVGLR